MATRYPLIVNPSTNQIQEIPAGDTLDLRGNDVNQLVVSGISTLGTIQISSGIITAASGIATYYGDGSNLTGVFTSTISIGTVGYATTVNLDMSTLNGKYNTISLTGDLQFTTSNRSTGRNTVIRLVCDSSQRTLTFPAGWVFVGTKPANIAGSKTAVLSLTFFGTADTDCVAAYGVQS